MIQTVSGLLKQEAARFKNKPTISALIARLDPFDASITRYFGLQSTGIAALREQHENNRTLRREHQAGPNAFLVVFRGAKMSSEVMLEAVTLGFGQKADNQLKAITETVAVIRVCPTCKWWPTLASLPKRWEPCSNKPRPSTRTPP